MAISVECECGKSLKLKDSAAGKRLKCPDCGAALDVPAAGDDYEEPEDDFGGEDDVPRRSSNRSGSSSRSGGRSRKTPPKKDNSPLIIGIVVGGLLAVGVGLGAFFALRGRANPPAPPAVAGSPAPLAPVDSTGASTTTVPTPAPTTPTTTTTTTPPTTTPPTPAPTPAPVQPAPVAAAANNPFWLALSNFQVGKPSGPFGKPYTVDYRITVGAPQANKKYVLYVGQGSGSGFIEHYVEVDVNPQAKGTIEFSLGPGFVGTGKLSAYFAEKEGRQKWNKVSGEIAVGGAETAAQPPPSVAQVAGAAAVGKLVAIANAKVGAGFAGRTEITVEFAIQGTIPADGFLFMVAKNPAGNGVEFDVTQSLRRGNAATGNTLGGGVLGPSSTGPFTIHIEKRKSPFRTPFDRDAPEILSNTVSTQ